MKHQISIGGLSIADIIWRIFLIWAAVGLLVTGLEITTLTVQSWGLPAPLERFFSTCLVWGDFIFNALAAWVVWSVYAGWVGPARAFACLVVVGACGAAAEWVGTVTGFPFGDYHYTGNMGPMIAGQVPWAIPLAWWSVVGALHLMARMLVKALGPWGTGILVGMAATAFDWLMEPYAWQIKAYWIWHGGSVPWLNYASWFVLAAVFSVLLYAIGAITPPSRHHPTYRPITVIALMLAIFLLHRLV